MATMALRTSSKSNKETSLATSVCGRKGGTRWRAGSRRARKEGIGESGWRNREQFYAAQKARGKVRGAPPREPHQGGCPPGPPGQFPFFAMFQNGPRRQGFAAPREKRAPLTAPGRSENPTEIRERGLVRNGLSASLPLVDIAAPGSVGKKNSDSCISLLTPTGLLMEAATARERTVPRFFQNPVRERVAPLLPPSCSVRRLTS
jgi:hypothetical protein